MPTSIEPCSRPRVSEPRAEAPIKVEAIAVDKRLLAHLLALFWITLVILFTAHSVDEGWAGRLAGLGRRVPLALLGAGMCWFMFLALKRLQRRSAVRRLAVMACISLPFGVVFSAINSWLMYLLSPSLGQN